MKIDLKWIVPIIITVLLTVGAGVVAIPWKLDGRYEQKVQAAERHSIILQRVGGMDRTYVQSRLDDLRWKLMTLKSIKRQRGLTPPEQEMYDGLVEEIKRLKKKLEKMR